MIGRGLVYHFPCMFEIIRLIRSNIPELDESQGEWLEDWGPD